MQLKLEQLWQMFARALLSELNLPNLQIALGHVTDHDFERLMDRCAVQDPAERSYFRRKFQEIKLASEFVLVDGDEDVQMDDDPSQTKLYHNPAEVIVDSIWDRRRQATRFSQDNKMKLETGQCVLCEEVAIDDSHQFYTISSCGHQVCAECLDKYLEATYSQGNVRVIAKRFAFMTLSCSAA